MRFASSYLPAANSLSALLKRIIGIKSVTVKITTRTRATRLGTLIFAILIAFFLFCSALIFRSSACLAVSSLSCSALMRALSSASFLSLYHFSRRTWSFSICTSASLYPLIVSRAAILFLIALSSAEKEATLRKAVA